MESLRAYLNDLDPNAQDDFASRCGTTVGYLRKAISVGQRISEGTVIAIERESGGKVRCEALRPDVDWKYLRSRTSGAVARNQTA
jgi:DNA-binding transcriptional regulator YdaS (Cro superfamily)